MDLENNRLDQKLKSLLEDYKPVDSQPDWKHMQNILQNQIQDDAFDRSIKEKLADIKIHAPEADWQHFKARREQRRHMISARVIEAVLVLLILWTSNRLIVPDMLETKNPTQSFANQSLNINSQLAQLPSSSEVNTAYNLIYSISGKNENPVVKSSMRPAQYNKNPIEKNISGSARPFIAEQSKKVFDHKSLISYVANGTANANHGLNANDDSHENTTSQHLHSLTELNHIIPSNESIHHDVLSTLVAIDNIHEIETFNFPKEEIYTEPIRPQKVRSGKFQLGLFGGVNMNYISSYPFLNNELAEQPSVERSKKQVAPQPTAGFHIHFKSYPWSVESGVSMTQFRYNPRLQSIFSDSSDREIKRSYDEFAFYSVNIPITLLRHIWGNRQTNIWAKAGLSLSASLKNKYKYSESYLTTDKGKSQPKEIQSSLAAISKLIPEVPLYEGLLDQGGFGQNSFINLVAGIRVTQRTHFGCELFADIDYNRMLGEFGFGPRRDHFQGLQFNFGSIIKL